jgi:ribonucleotide reductase alpha subunit
MNYDGPTEECKQKISETAKIIWNTEAGKQSRREAGIFSTKSKAMKCGNTLFNLVSDIDQNNWNSFKKLAYDNGIGHFIKSDTILKYWDNWESFENDCLNYNHKIVKIIDDCNEDVYNITVDEFHTIAYITNTTAISKGKLPKLTGIFTFQCGEQPLAPNSSCVLGSINLSKFVLKCPTQFPSGGNYYGYIDWKRLKEVVRIAVRFLDNVIDVNNYPIPEIEIETKKFRKIGLGVMGWADMLIKLQISYNSPEALELAEKVMKFINDEAVKYSEELAEEKGFGTWEGYNNPEIGIFKETDMSLFKRRNATLTTIAPTGTLSLIAGCSSGIEPVFSFEFKKKCLDKEIAVKHPLWEEYLNEKE